MCDNPLHNRSGICRDTGPQLRALLRDRPAHGATLHLALIVDDDTRTVLEVDEHALLPPEALALSDDDDGHDLLPQLRLTLPHGAHAHVSGPGLGQAVQPAADVAYGDDVQVLRAGVVGAVHDGRDG